ncbi:MAG: DUF2125 domain-containing protein [Pseudomonadota bacterium]
MARIFSPGTCRSALSLVVLLSGGAAKADLTAADVWNDWQGYMASSGYAVTATQTVSGNTLSVTDITLSIESPGDDGAVSVSLGALDFVENDDGTVSVKMPETFPMTVAARTLEEGDVNVGMQYTAKGFEMLASGDPNNVLYNYSADEIGLDVETIEVEGDSFEIGDLSLSLAKVVGTTEMNVTDLRNSLQRLASESLTYRIDVTDPDTGGTFFLTTALAGLDVTATGAVPIDADMTDMAATLDQGFDAGAEFSYASGQSQLRIVDADQTLSADTSSQGGMYKVDFGKSGLTYAIGVTGLSLFSQGGDLPLPVEMAFAEAAFNVTMPLTQSDAEQDFALGINLGDFTVSDLLWGLIDPTAQLPRDPATLALDLTGKAKVFLDLLDPEQMVVVETEGTIPGELNSLSLNSLQLSLAGAELTGKGAFAFDNTDLDTFDGMPAPEGAIDLVLTGGNGLLDRLIAMGLVPEDQAMGVRMMMGLFAVPGAGEDTLTSKIEVTADGQILANGQRLR